MFVENNSGDAINRPANSGNLHQNFGTGAIFRYHRLDAANMSFDPRETVNNLLQGSFAMDVGSPFRLVVMACLVVVVKGVERGNLISQGLTVNSVILSSVPHLQTPAPSIVLSSLNFRSGVFGLKEGVGCGVWGVGCRVSGVAPPTPPTSGGQVGCGVSGVGCREGNLFHLWG